MLRREKRFVQLKQKALEPQHRFCALLKKKVCILVEYSDYKNYRYKGEQGTIYCENIIECYHNNIRCRYSGISPSYPDPLVPVQDMEKYMEPGEGVCQGDRLGAGLEERI